MKHINSFELFENENTPKIENLKDLRKAMRKASNERGSGVYGMFANPSTWGIFQFAPVDTKWLNDGHMSVLQTGDITSIIKRANSFLNPLGWEMIDGPSQRSVTVKKLA